MNLCGDGFVVLYTNPRKHWLHGRRFHRRSAAHIQRRSPRPDGGVDAHLKGYVDESVLCGWLQRRWRAFQLDDRSTDRRCGSCLAVAGQLVEHGGYLRYSLLHAVLLPKALLAEEPTDWLKHSSIMYVGNVTTPTLVMTGEKDLRTPMAQSEEYYAALKVQECLRN